MLVLSLYADGEDEDGEDEDDDDDDGADAFSRQDNEAIKRVTRPTLPTDFGRLQSSRLESKRAATGHCCV